MWNRRLVLAILPIAAAALWLTVAPAAAHDHFHTDPYEFTVGWTSEPPIVGAPNGLDLGIEVDVGNNSTEPVAGVAANLTATLMSGGASVVKALDPQFGNPGSYTFDVIPTRGGAYSVRIAGTLNGTVINFTADLEAPEAREDLEFPVADPSPHDLQEALEDANADLAAEHANATALAARVAALEAACAGAKCGPDASASTAMLIGFAGLAAGAAGLAIGVMALRKGKAQK